MSEIVVRAQEPADAEAIAAIFGCPGVVAGTLQLPLRSVAAARERAAQASPDIHRLVAELDGGVVGALGMHVETTPRRRHCAGIGMGVRDDCQRRGVGTALLAAALDLADNWLGLRRIELEVYVDNGAAVRLYEKHGFAIEGTLRDYAFRAGGYVDAYAMARLRG